MGYGFGFGGRGSGFKSCLVDPHRLIESLDLTLAQILVFEWEALRHHLISRPLDTYTSWLGQLLQSLRQHHTFSGHRIIGKHHFSHRNTDTNSRTDIVWHFFVAGRIRSLESKRRSDGIRRFGKPGKKRVPPNPKRFTVMV